jgi:hypothetical protein
VTQSCSAVLVITKSDHDSRSCQGEETLRGAIKRSLMRVLKYLEGSIGHFPSS